MTTATFIRQLEDWKGDARLFELSDTITYEDSRETRFVVVSATVVPFSGPETYIFPADETGKILDWGELPGSFRGGLSHPQAISNAGWTLLYE